MNCTATERDFIDLLRRRTASAAITPSAGRNMGAGGMIKSGRLFLRDHVDLRELAESSEQDFPRVLDRLTRRMQRTLSPFLRDGHTGWGPCRKFLNIYLRDALYNCYLRQAFCLNGLESVMEVPLDRDVGTFLADKDADASLPRWTSVCGLNAETSAKYQESAARVAKKMRTDRVHLDVAAWRRNSI